jgi:hypothetical protein
MAIAHVVGHQTAARDDDDAACAQCLGKLRL